MAQASNSAAVTFPANTGVLEVVTHFGIGYAAYPNAGVLYASAALPAPVNVAVGGIPTFAIGDLDVNLTTTASEFESAFLVNMLKLYFQNVDHAFIGDAAGLQNSAAAGNIYVSLHTADPAGGDQTTSEATYLSYDRVAVVRGAGTWTVV